MSEIDSDAIGPWLPPEDLRFAREKVPMVYVNIVLVRLDEAGALEAMGILLCADDGGINRTFPSGRTLLCETIREALARYIDKDLGPMALPRIPAVLTPFTVDEYFPMGESWHDPHQHAVSLVYIVAMQGDYNPGDDSFELLRFTPGETCTREPQAELTPAHASLLRRALAVFDCDT